MQHPDLSKFLARGYPSDGNLPALNRIDECTVGGDHRVTSEPHLSDLEIGDDVEESVHVVVMSMRENDHIQAPNAPVKQIGTHHILADREGTFVAQTQETACRDAPSIDQHAASIGKFDQRRISLTNIQESHNDVARWSWSEVDYGDRHVEHRHQGQARPA